MVNPDPNKKAILAIRAVQSAARVHAILVSHGLSLALDVIQAIMAVSSGSDMDQACLIEFCSRHGGITGHNASRFVSECLGGSHTNRCSSCKWIGHNKNHCCN
jgi:hypothetical protein